MSDLPSSQNLTLEPQDNLRLSNLCGPLEDHLHQIERRLGIEINHRGHDFHLLGPAHAVSAGKQLLEQLYQITATELLDAERIHIALQDAGIDELLATAKRDIEDVVIKTQRGLIRGRGQNQKEYLHNIVTHDINFGVGPAGTGKTFLAVACAVEAIERQSVRRILLVRPAVEAGEKLGFLPGDLSQKIDPYLRPLYDALYEMLGFERVHKLIERSVIEVAPLAYMRGRTLNDAYIILDEAQNTTPEQMKMFLTRIGFGSTAVITGDVTQVDLPVGKKSGLRHALDVLANVKGISFTFFNSRDVVRHALVQQVIEAYERSEK